MTVAIVAWMAFWLALMAVVTALLALLKLRLLAEAVRLLGEALRQRTSFRDLPHGVSVFDPALDRADAIARTLERSRRR